jgi:sugar lactone lactonase YvrE
MKSFNSFLKSALFGLTALVGLLSCKEGSEALNVKIPEVINFSAETLYPEGMAYYNKSKVFIVSSIKHGTIGTVSLTGQYTTLISDPGLISSFGMKISGKFLYVCLGDLGNGVKSSPATATKVARVIKIDLDQKKIVQTYNLENLFTGAIFSNDLAIDNSGNIYVTESLSGLIYKIDNSGQASVFLDHQLFKGEGFNLNGIAFHPDGFLLVDKTNSGKLFKVDLNTKVVTEVILPKAIDGADGLTLKGENLYCVSFSGNTVSELKSTDSWKTATFTSQDNAGYQGPTAATVAEGDVYVLNAKVTEIFGDPSKAMSNTFSIKKYKAVNK